MKTNDEVADSVCPLCNNVVREADFVIDSISHREFLISGLCGSCQDDVFGVDDDLADAAARSRRWRANDDSQ